MDQKHIKASGLKKLVCEKLLSLLSVKILNPQFADK